MTNRHVGQFTISHMNTNNHGILITLAILVTLFFIVLVAESAHKDKELAKAGLQQCVVQGKTVWQRECGK